MERRAKTEELRAGDVKGEAKGEELRAESEEQRAKS